MELALTILAALSSLLFIVLYGKIIFTSFKHHVIIGLISLVPGLNLVILPSVWDKVGRAFIMSIVSLGVAFTTWHFNGYSYLQKSNILPRQQTTQTNATQEEQPTKQEVIEDVLSDDIEEISLPQKPIHYIVFVDAAKDKYSGLSNDDLRITLTDNRIIEGKSTKATAEFISIEQYNPQGLASSPVQTIKMANIKRLQTLSTQ